MESRDSKANIMFDTKTSRVFAFLCVACVWRLGTQFRSASVCRLGSTRDRRDGIVFVLRSGLRAAG